MKILAPWSPLSLDFYKEGECKTLTMIAENDLWNFVFDDAQDTKLLAKNAPWQDAFKNSVKLIEKLDTEGWELDDEGYTVPLFVTEGSSDKEYHVNLTKTPTGWNTICLYGRRGSTLATAEKAMNASMLEAWKQFRDVTAKKSKDGYQFYVAGVEYQAGARFEKVPSLAIQYLTEASDVNALIEDDAYWLQEKFDGERRPVVKTVDTVLGTNKEGMSVNLNKKFEQELNVLTATSFKLDCEDLGDKLAIFDITELNGVDLAKTSFEQRYAQLCSLFANNKSSCLILAKAYKTTAEKRDAIATLLARRAEGVVFKKRSAGYSNGKNLEGTQQKFKFYSEATVVVVAKNQKRSVQVGVVQDTSVIPVGNVTIPANAEIPEVGQIVEVRYLYAYKGGCLFLPTYKGLRPDQTLSSCGIEKLKYKADYDYAQEVCANFA